VGTTEGRFRGGREDPSLANFFAFVKVPTCVVSVKINLPSRESEARLGELF